MWLRLKGTQDEIMVNMNLIHLFAPDYKDSTRTRLFAQDPKDEGIVVMESFEEIVNKMERIERSQQG